MNIETFEIKRDTDFTKQVDRFLLKKKFRRLPKQIQELYEKFKRGEFEGDKMTHRDVPTPHDVYKLRLPPDTGAGKSNGYRLIYMVVTEFKIVIFLTIYYKKEEEVVSDTYINGLVDGYFLNLLQEEE